MSLRRLRRHLPTARGGGGLKKTRRRLQRTPPRPEIHRVTRFWFLRRFTAVAYLWRPTFARTVGGPGRRTNYRPPCDDQATMSRAISLTDVHIWGERWLSRATSMGRARNRFSANRSSRTCAAQLLAAATVRPW